MFTLPVPTHVITGFLGTGKTTTILQLLANKPADQHWAVLVNEFGDIGIDGALLADSGATITEVPGGCICCAQGVAMQVALQQLLKHRRPDRLLIEPTGLGHPAALLEQLAAWQGTLTLQATLTLVDPAKLADQRLRLQPLFMQQLQVADVLVFNKTDRPDCPSQAASYALADQLALTSERLWTTQGQIPLAALATPPRPIAQKWQTQNPHDAPVIPASLTVPDGELYVSRQQQRDGLYSAGLLFRPGVCFDFRELWFLFSAYEPLRLKAVMYTEKGTMTFNAADSTLAINELALVADSRVELIDDQPIALEPLITGLIAALREDN
ncbi:CobW family GTP-binding protein [Gallaecimonas sp. GXIMD1310]|uniref:CobW family GTP-binding protein n=1 Tax=Gallaecimonas sp. GXIMD1310 TaxID=3131926 RepID=UPI00324B78A2